MTALEARRTSARKLVPTLCYNCVAGPDFMQVIVEDGVATGIEPNHRAVGVHPGAGRPCVRAYGLVPIIHTASASR